MRRLLSVIFLLAMLSLGAAAGGYPYKTSIFKMVFPRAWWLDPFSSSSVCDCPGVIAGSDEGKPKMVIYDSDAAGMQEPMRDQVWDYQWDAGFAGQADETFTSKSGVKFVGKRGQWEDHADEMTVVRLEASSRGKYVRVFIFGLEGEMQEHYAETVGVLSTFSWH